MTPQELVRSVEQLVSLPDLFLRVNEMIDSHRYSAVDIAHVLSQDTNLSARLLKMVNSSFYGLPGRVDTISRAITIIGTSDLRNLAITTATTEVFNRIPADLIDMNKFWHNAVSVGVFAKELASCCNVLHAERLFVMGILHDVGRLIIYQTLPEQARDIHLVIQGDQRLFLEAERDILGFTHQEIGYELFKLWKLPESIRATARYHHDPSNSTEFQLETALVHLACHLAIAENTDMNLDETLLNIDQNVWAITGLVEPQIQHVREIAPALIHEMQSMIYDKPAISSSR